MGILVIAEHDNHAIRAATLNAVGAAAQLGGDITLLVAGSDCGTAADAGSGIAGVSKVLHVDALHYEHGLAEELAPLVAACSAGALRESATLAAIGLPEPLAQGTVRIGFGRTTTLDEVVFAAATLCSRVTALRNHA